MSGNLNLRSSQRSEKSGNNKIETEKNKNNNRVMEKSGSSGSKNKASDIMIPTKDLADYFPVLQNTNNKINQKNNLENTKNDPKTDLENGPTTPESQEGFEHQEEL